MPFVVEGHWQTSRGDKLVHREVVKDDSLKPKYDAIKSIRYTDGTLLAVSTYAIDDPPQKLGYKDMLDACIRQGLGGYISVMDIGE